MRKKAVKKGLNFFTIIALIFSLLVPFGTAQAALTVSKDVRGINVQDFIVNENKFIPQQAVFISPEISTKGSQKIRVIVEFQQQPVSVAKSAAEQKGLLFSAASEKQSERTIADAQNAFTKSLTTLGVKGKITSSYKTVFSGVALELPANQVPMLAKAKNVKAVYPVVEYQALPMEDPQPLMSESGPFIGSNDVWNLGYTGTGIKVGVVDTGIDYLHPDLAAVYRGGWDFVNNDDDPYETTPSDRPDGMPEVDESGSTYWTSHGTHVSGTIAAQGVQDNGVMGIAPGVELYVYKVLGPYGSGTSEWVIGGIERAVQDEMDVINLSLGNSLNDPDYPTSVALNNAMLAGTVAVTSNGNSGPDRWTVGSPSASAFAISVGASTPPGDRPLATGVSSLDATKSYDLKLMAFNPTEDYNQLLNQALEVVYVGLGYPEDYEGADVTGKIALVQRGEFALVDKSRFAKAAGAAAVLLYNNQSGYINYFAGDSVEFVSMFDMTKEDGEVLVAALSSGTVPNIIKLENENLNREDGTDFKYQPADIEKADPVQPSIEQPSSDSSINTSGSSNKTTIGLSVLSESPENSSVTFTITSYDITRYEGDEMASFSSRGPVKKTLDIKPDVVAPGVSIRSSIAAYGGDYTNAYERYQGTSMASPHVAGLAALILQANPGYTPFDVKAALMNTAKVIGDPTDPNYNVFSQGAGRVQGLEAVTTPVLAQVLDTTSFTDDGVLTEFTDITGSLSYGLAPLDAPFSSTKTIQLSDVSGAEHAYNVSVDFTNADTTGVSLTLDQTSVVLPADGQVDLAATMTVDNLAAAEGEYQGYITFTNEQNDSVHIPFVVYVGELDMPKGFGMVFQSPEDFSPNGDGILDTTDLYFEVYSEMTEQALLVWDPVAYEQGYNGGYIGQILYWSNAGDGTALPGFWYISFDGYYYDYRTEQWEILADGFYTLDWYGWDEETPDNEPYVTWNDLYVDTESPFVSGYTNIETNINDEKVLNFEGYLDDMYVYFEEFDKLSVNYELLSEQDGTIRSGDITIADDGSLSLQVPDIPAGLFELIITAEDIAGNYSERYYEVSNLPPATATFDPLNGEVELGGTYEVNFIADGVNNLVGGQLEIAYDDTVFTLQSVEASDAFLAGAGANGVVELVNDELGYNWDGLKRVAVGVSYSDQVEGISGRNALFTLVFTVTDDPDKSGIYNLEPSNIKFVDKDLNTIYPSWTDWPSVAVGTTSYKVTGTIQPEAFMENGVLKAGIDYSQIGAEIYAYNDQDWEFIDGIIRPDGTFEINLSPDGIYTLYLNVPGHFRSVIENVTVTEDTTVSFGFQYAGDINRDDVVDIEDVVPVAYFYGLSVNSYGYWDNYKAKYADINQDGTIDIIDLSYVTEHFFWKNELLPWEVLEQPLLKLPDGTSVMDVIEQLE